MTHPRPGYAAARTRCRPANDTECDTLFRRCREPTLPTCDKILDRARRSAANLRFAEALALAECLGFELARIRGSHGIFKRAGFRGVVDLQPDARDASKAKKRQVEQLLTLFDGLGFSEER